MDRDLSKLVSADLNINLEDTERHELCLVPCSPTEAALLKRRAKAGELVCPRRGMYARASLWEKLNAGGQALRIARTLALGHPTWVLSHTSAALVHGFNVPYRVCEPIHYITGKAGGGVSGPGFVHHRSDKFEWGVLRDVRVTSPAKTVVDCARILELPDALAIADSALRSGIVTKELLFEHLAQNARQRGTSTARRAIELADPRAESGGESVARGTLIELGYRIHDLQLVVPDLEARGKTHRLDIVLAKDDGSLVDLEVDGRGKYEDLAMTEGKDAVEVMMHERQRESRITAHGIPVVRISGSDAYNKALFTKRLAAYGVFPVEQEA